MYVQNPFPLVDHKRRQRNCESVAEYLQISAQPISLFDFVAVVYIHNAGRCSCVENNGFFNFREWMRIGKVTTKSDNLFVSNYCRFSSRPWLARPSPLRLSPPILLTTSSRRSRTRRAFPLINRDWSSPASSSRTAALWGIKLFQSMLNTCTLL